uniref:Uncharacterized protein n=1 Tax=Oryza rufipogon TaxID=4529 RepID=A0A0E0PKY4_ORYRU
MTRRLGGNGGAGADATGAGLEARCKGVVAVQRELAAVFLWPKLVRRPAGGGTEESWASSRGGGKVLQHVWKSVGGGVPVQWGGGLMLSLPVRWFLS